MTTHQSGRINRFCRLLALAPVFTGAAACQDTPTPPGDSTLALTGAASRLAAHARKGLLEVTARGHTFEAPDEIPSGWTTVRFNNASPAAHFVILEKLPPGKTLEDSKAEVVPVFQEGMDLLIEGKVNEALATFGKLPAWYFSIVFMGGPGITAPGRTSEVTVNLDPGTYVLECYVKTPDGKFHSYLGMIDQVIVVDEASGAREPTPTLAMTLRNDGIDFGGDPRPGKHTIAVHFAEQQVHGNFLGNDAHLVRLEDDADLAEVAAWMNWSLPAGLATPAPADFVGGLHEMPPGHTGYIDVVLKPGRYAWIAEVDDPAGKDMLKTFTVPFGRATGN
jgi:hypothetical protein